MFIGRSEAGKTTLSQAMKGKTITTGSTAMQAMAIRAPTLGRSRLVRLAPSVRLLELFRKEMLFISLFRYTFRLYSFVSEM